LLATSSISYSQDLARVYKADSICFYGYDFSHAIVKTKHPINDYVFPWIIHASEINPPSYFEKKMYMNVIHDFSYTNKVNIEFIENLVVRNESKIIEEDETTGRYPLLFDKPNMSSKKHEEISVEIENEVIQKHLFEYSLTQQTGIGLVVFVAEINKEEESTLLHFVFFDIKGRNIISAYKSHLSGAKGIGMEEHWKHNFSMSVNKFLEEYNKVLYFNYREEYKRKRKRMKKLRGK
jgi:hypothetical protein